MLKIAALLFMGLGLLAQEGSRPRYEMYAGYYGVATMKGAGECRVVSLNPFGLE